MANYGYGYTRSEVVDLATSLAVHLGLREKDKPFTLNWFYSFMSRWPELKTIKARGLAMTRAKSASQENIDKYFQELEKIISKYNLQDKPYCIYNVDEKGINFQHKPPNVVSSKQSKPPGIVSEKSPILTIIGAGNALGTQIPPYLIFQGARMNPDLLQNCSEGTAGTVSASGWSNTDIFQKYLSEHFIKYVQGLTNDQPVLLIYDGHKSHVALSVIEWAKAHNIIILVLPAHCSHILQPLDVGCFGPLNNILNNACHKYIHEHREPINRYNIGKLASDAYVKALSPNNLQNSFAKAGIYPFDQNCVSAVTLLPSTLFNSDAPTDNDHDSIPLDDEIGRQDKGTDKDCGPEIDVNSDRAQTDMENNTTRFFDKCEQNLKIEKKQSTQKRKYLSSITSGKAVTESEIMNEIVEHCKKSGASKNNEVCSKKRKSTETKSTDSSRKVSKMRRHVKPIG